MNPIESNHKFIYYGTITLRPDDYHSGKLSKRKYRRHVWRMGKLRNSNSTPVATNESYTERARKSNKNEERNRYWTI